MVRFGADLKELVARIAHDLLGRTTTTLAVANERERERERGREGAERGKEKRGWE